MAYETSTTKSGSARAQEITDANAEFVAFVETCTEEEWSRVSAAEGWPVNAVADHIAWGHEILPGGYGPFGPAKMCPAALRRTMLPITRGRLRPPPPVERRSSSSQTET